MFLNRLNCFGNVSAPFLFCFCAVSLAFAGAFAGACALRLPACGAGRRRLGKGPGTGQKLCERSVKAPCGKGLHRGQLPRPAAKLCRRKACQGLPAGRGARFPACLVCFLLFIFVSTPQTPRQGMARTVPDFSACP